MDEAIKTFIYFTFLLAKLKTNVWQLIWSIPDVGHLIRAPQFQCSSEEQVLRRDIVWLDLCSHKVVCVYVTFVLSWKVIFTYTDM